MGLLEAKGLPQQSSRFVEAKLPSGCLPDEAHLASLFALHVHRLSAEDDVIVGAALPSVGPAVLPLRLDFSSSSPAAARTFATVAAAAKAHLEVAKDAVLPLGRAGWDRRCSSFSHSSTQHCRRMTSRLRQE